MKVVSLCHPGHGCAEVRMEDEYVEIGEKDNLCRLTRDEWEVLKEMILSGEL